MNQQGRKLSILHRDALMCLLLAIGTGLIFSPVVNYDFIYLDDPTYVTNNDQVMAGMTVDGVRWAFTTRLAGNWHPLTWLSHMLDCELFEINPGGHHLTNLLIHSVNTGLLFFLLHAMTGAFWRSGFVAAAFGIHPLRIESVAWISERKDVLSVLFFLLTVAAYIHYTRRYSVPRYLLMIVTFALGLMSKPMLVTLPCVLLLLDWWPLRRVRFGAWNQVVDHDAGTSEKHRSRTRSVHDLIWEKSPLLLLSGASCIITFVVQQSGGAVASLEQMPLRIRLANAAVTYVSYIVKTIWPFPMAVLYPHPGSSLPIWLAIVALLLLLAISVCAIRVAQKHEYLLVGWLWYLGTLVPVIGLVQIGRQAMADRYTYLPSIGLFIMIAWGSADVFGRLGLRRAIPALTASVAIGLMMIGTCIHLPKWKDSSRLFLHALEVTKNNYVIHNNYGGYLYDHRRFEEAATHVRQSLRIKPSHASAQANLGHIYWQQGKTGQAMDAWQKVLQIDPDQIEPANNLAWIKATHHDPALRDPNEAVRLARHACEVARYENPVVLDTLAAASAALGNFAEAADHAQKALDLARRYDDRRLEDTIRKHLEYYQRGEPYVDVPAPADNK